MEVHFAFSKISSVRFLHVKEITVHSNVRSGLLESVFRRLTVEPARSYVSVFALSLSFSCA